MTEVQGHGIGAQPPGEPVFTVRVGSGSESADLYVDGCGWRAYVGSRPSQLSEGSESLVIGPLTAACRGAAHAFVQVMADFMPSSMLPEPVYWSALDYSGSEEPLQDNAADSELDLDAVLVGAGSVGGAAMYALGRIAGLRGQIAVADPQHLEERNWDRALLAPRTVSATQAGKAEAAAQAMAHCAPELQVIPHQGTIAELLAARARHEVLPLVLCAVDSAAARRSVQDCLPLELINAACHPREVTVSGHRTGAGPCVCCLHMRDVLDKERTRTRLIARGTGFNEAMVIALRLQKAPMAAEHLRAVERHRELPDRALDDYLGWDVDRLWDERLVYGGVELHTAEGAQLVVAAPWVTALAGFLLAGEATKAAGGDTLAPYRLGPDGGPAGKYEENVYTSPAYSLRSTPARWATNECLCRSPRRRRLTIERYGLDPATYAP